jgi:ribokinase
LEYKNRFSIPQNLIVTVGDRGDTIYRLGYEEVTYSTNQVEVVDVCGCGDTFLAAFAYKYLFTHAINDAIIYANVAAGVTVQHRGNYAPTLEEIENARY